MVANRRHVRSWYYLAQHCERHLKDEVRAQECFRQAVELNPRHTNSLKDFANLLRSLKKFDEVRVSVLDPTASLVMCLGVQPGLTAWPSCALPSRVLQAEQMYKQALSVDSGHPRTVENYARFLMDVRGDTTASIELLKRWVLVSVGKVEKL